MPYHQEVDPPASPDPEAENVPSNQGDTKILGDNPEGEMHNISFDESQHKVLQSRRLSTLDDNTSPAQLQERVTVSDMHKHLVALANATIAYTEAISSSVRLLIIENEQMAKELWVAKQGGEHVTTSTQAELKRAILSEVSSLEIVMQTFVFQIHHYA